MYSYFEQCTLCVIVVTPLVVPVTSPVIAVTPIPSNCCLVGFRKMEKYPGFLASLSAAEDQDILLWIAWEAMAYSYCLYTHWSNQANGRREGDRNEGDQ